MFLYRIAIKPDNIHAQRVAEGIISSILTLCLYNLFIAPEPMIYGLWIIIVSTSGATGYFVACFREQEMKHKTTIAIQKAIKAFFQAIICMAMLFSLLIVMITLTKSENITQSRLLYDSNYFNLIWSFLIISIIVAIATFFAEK